MTSRDRIKTRDMILDRRTGRFHAAGPGWITSTRYDTADLSTACRVTPAGRAANSTWTQSRASRLIYLRVDYQNGIEGNIDKREAVFQHYVRAVYGPVQAWDQTLDPDQRGGLGPQGIVMTCQRLFVTETGQAPQRGIELSAVGDTLVEGNTFTAQPNGFRISKPRINWCWTAKTGWRGSSSRSNRVSSRRSFPPARSSTGWALARLRSLAPHN